ncbi:MAG: hypothetical protein ABI895_34585 [Deltaproteobacteria bacterium]
MRQRDGQRRRHWRAGAAWFVAALAIGCSPNASEENNRNSNAPTLRENMGVVLCGDNERCGNDPVNENDPTRVTTGGPGTVVFGPDDVSSGGIRLSDKMDLLFVVDNSVSMGDKQQIFAAAIPDLLARLVNPPCLNPMALDLPIQPATPEEACPTGYGRQFKPLKDIHVGIVTSSLGAHGADAVLPSSGCEEADSDRAHMMGTLERGRVNPSYQDLGFLAWDPEQRSSPAGSTNLQDIQQGFVDMLATVGEAGCGFEAPLEAMYRFLMDPAPPASLQRVPCSTSDTGENCVRSQGIDQALLSQRAAFLRKDSVVAILMLADEDDCSVRDTDIGWWQMDLVRGMTRASSTCETDPNSPCCYACSFATPAGCTPREQDPACCPPGENGAACTETTPLLSYEEDRTRFGGNLRCYDQKRKYGYDYLYPVQRYVLGLTSPWLPEGFDEQGRPLVNAQGEIRFLKNPLYSEPVDDNGNVRSKDQVFFVGIVGVPWQDVATPETRDAAGQLDLIPATQFAASGLWERILGSKADGVLPLDPFAQESEAPRSGVNPVTQDPIRAPDSVTFNPINGKERDVADDLQFACIFPLPQPRSCANVAPGSSCDCQTDKFQGNPLCWDQASTTYTNTQRFAKAYPAPRILSVLQAVGTQAVVSSICPKDMADTNARDFGYRPVIGTFVKEAARILIK